MKTNDYYHWMWSELDHADDLLPTIPWLVPKPKPSNNPFALLSPSPTPAERETEASVAAASEPPCCLACGYFGANLCLAGSILPTTVAAGSLLVLRGASNHQARGGWSGPRRLDFYLDAAASIRTRGHAGSTSPGNRSRPRCVLRETLRSPRKRILPSQA